jgi:hypothetical protein
MRSYEAGHSEIETALPEPLTAKGVWSLTTFALPSSQLSFASAAIFLVVLAYLVTGGAEQELFVLPCPGSACIAAVAAALAWTIAVRCRRRPGRIWTRLWALSLACVSTFTVIAGLVFHDRPWPLALAVAALASAATLAPRLTHVRPDSALVQRVAPLGMIVVAVAVLPATCTVRRAIAAQTEQRVSRHIQQFRLWTSEVNEVTSYDWRRLEESPEAAARVVEKLKNLDFARSADDDEMWRSAAILGRDAELASAVGQLSDAVVAGFAPERVPRVSTLHEPAVRWDVENKRWEAYSQFAPLSEITGTYHQELGQRFAELNAENASGENAKLADYRQHYAANRQTLASHLSEIGSSWADNWAAFRVPGYEEITRRQRTSLHDLLRTPFLHGENESFAPGDLPRLSALPLHDLKRLSRGSPGCDSRGELAAGSRPTGCRCVNFSEDPFEFYRLDCYSYAPRTEGTGAELRIEMRLVYRSEWHDPLRDWTRPAEIYFHFLIPDGENRDEYRERVMNGLATVARGQSAASRLPSHDRGASVAGGFSIPTDNGTVRVLRPEIVTLTGLTPEPSALRVRVVRNDGARPGRS